MRFIGDIHGDFEAYKKLIDCPESIQIGDYGAGFGPLPELPLNHRFIRGNHDDPAICKASPNWIEDGFIDETYKAMFIGGAFSIDRAYRTEGKNWWPDEELSHAKLYAMTDRYLEAKPMVMVTHDCPSDIMQHFFGYQGKTRTQQAFDAMFANHRPYLWIFGHHHQTKMESIFGTTFLCLGINEIADIDMVRFS